MFVNISNYCYNIGDDFYHLCWRLVYNIFFSEVYKMPILSIIITLIFYKATEYDFFILLSIISITIDIALKNYHSSRKLKKILKKIMKDTKDKTIKDT